MGAAGGLVMHAHVHTNVICEQSYDSESAGKPSFDPYYSYPHRAAALDRARRCLAAHGRCTRCMLRVSHSTSAAASSQIQRQNAAPLLIRENNREYENTVDTIVQRAREQERIVREWDIEMERLLERQYRMNYDDVVREFNHKVREYCL